MNNTWWSAVMRLDEAWRFTLLMFAKKIFKASAFAIQSHIYSQVLSFNKFVSIWKRCSKQCNRSIANGCVHVLQSCIVKTLNDVRKHFQVISELFKWFYYTVASWIMLLFKWVWHANVCKHWLHKANKLLQQSLTVHLWFFNRLRCVTKLW